MPQAKRNVAARPRLEVSLARNVAEVRAAQRLRYQVFAREMGAQVPGREQGIDCDLFDAYCDHLIVTDVATSAVVGTYRLLHGEQARRAGSFYSDQEFDLRALDGVRLRAVEAGRACVHADYRGSGVLALLWMGITEYVLQRGCEYLIGCASVGLDDGGVHAAQIYHSLAAEHLSPPAYRVTPRRPWPVPQLGDVGAAYVLPTLLKGYRKLGAYLCGAPAWDPAFNTADLFLMLPVARIDARYMRRWAKAPAYGEARAGAPEGMVPARLPA